MMAVGVDMTGAGGQMSEEERQAQLRGLRNLQRGVGEVALLLAGHPQYKGLFLGDLRRMVMPAVLYNQYRVVRNRSDRTVAYVSWARVSDAVHERLMSGRLKLKLQDWTGGEHAVVMDVAAPTTAGGGRVLRELKSGVFAEENLWVVRTNAGLHEPKLALYEPSSEEAADG